jgi:hypothetical protein
MEFLSLFERTVLEKIYNNPKTIDELTKEIKIDPFLIFNTLNYLIQKKLVIFKDEAYQIAKNHKKEVYNSLKCPASQSVAINEIVQNVSKNISETKNSKFKFKKLKLSEDDFKIYKTMMANIESFLLESHKKNNEVKNEKIIFWGNEDYSSLLNSISQGI